MQMSVNVQEPFLMVTVTGQGMDSEDKLQSIRKLMKEMEDRLKGSEYTKGNKAISIGLYGRTDRFAFAETGVYTVVKEEEKKE